MFHFHQMNCFSNTLWFVPVNWLGSSCGHCTKTAAAGANISKYHERCCAFSPAFSHVGTIATLANSVKFMGIDEATDMLIVFTNGKLDTKPVGFFYFLLLGNYWKFCHCNNQ